MSSGGSRLLGNYGDQQSWSTMYNLFADKMLGLDFVPQSVSFWVDANPLASFLFSFDYFRSSICRRNT